MKETCIVLYFILMCLNSVFQSIVIHSVMENYFFIERLKDEIKDICLEKIRKAFLIGN